MKILTNTLIALSISTTALADRSQPRPNQFTEYARVVNALPIYKQLSYQQPKRECWIEEQQPVIRYQGQDNPRRTNSHSSGDVLIGGVIGGVIGNQLSRKSSHGARTGATVAGAIIGSALAGESNHRGKRNKRHRRHSESHNNRYQRQPSYETRPVKRCEYTTETHYEERLQGYDVTYRYRGENFKTRMKRDPGERIRVQVSVTPLP
ncbi:MAG: glycine zipper 2TM domain-containing protein [Granulosicoccaceae bacterium]